MKLGKQMEGTKISVLGQAIFYSTKRKRVIHRKQNFAPNSLDKTFSIFNLQRCFVFIGSTHSSISIYTLGKCRLHISPVQHSGEVE